MIEITLEMHDTEKSNLERLDFYLTEIKKGFNTNDQK